MNGKLNWKRLWDWTKLFTATACLWGFIYGAAPLMQKIQSVKTVHDYVVNHEIDASALYYTDSPEMNGADLYIRDSLQY